MVHIWILVLLLMVPSAAGQTQACESISQEEAYKYAFAIFEGRVTKISAPCQVWENCPKDYARAKLIVSSVWKGYDLARADVYVHDSEDIWNIFVENQKYLVYANENLRKGNENTFEPFLAASECSGRVILMDEASADMHELGKAEYVAIEADKAGWDTVYASALILYFILLVIGVTFFVSWKRVKGQ